MMKLEVTLALEAPSQVACSRARNRSSKVLSSEVINGAVPQRCHRRKKKRLKACDDRSDDFASSTGIQIPADGVIGDFPGHVEDKSLGLKANVPSKGGSIPFVFSENEKENRLETMNLGEGSAQKRPDLMDDESARGNVYGANNDSGRKPLTGQFTRPSLLKLKSEVDVSVSGTVASGSEAMEVDTENGTESTMSATIWSKFEPMISKRISQHKPPLSITELLQTGLLDGMRVTYMERKKAILGGIIKDSGILCSCTSCKGLLIVAPSKFELHARKVYSNAARCIYLENGKNISHVLGACRGIPLDALQTTIQKAVGFLPLEKHIICLNCKGLLSVPSTLTEDSLCHSCIKSKNSQDMSTHTIETRSRSPKSVLTSKSLDGALVSNSSMSKNQWKITKKSRMSVPTSKSLEGALVSKSSTSKSQWKITKKAQRLHKLVFEEAGLPDGTELAYYGCGQKLLEGYKKGSGIFCFCCNFEVSPSVFEVHAGWASRKKPYHHIYTSNGVSLHELSLSLSKVHKFSAKDNDDLCVICADGGNLLLCDGCPRAFHKDCASLSRIPRGKWYCNYCQNMFGREKYVAHNANALAAGRVLGADSIKQITKRCIRIVENPEPGATGCALCRGSEFDKSGFGCHTVIFCDQCEKEYHVGCLKDHKMADLKILPKGKWFCSMDCKKIHSILHKLLVCGGERLPDSLLDIIKKKHKEECLNSIEFDIRWRLLNGKMASPESRLLLSKAVSIFHDCFGPILDPNTGKDLIPLLVYGRSLRDQEFGGMYCAILTVNSTIVTTGVLRIFGQGIAELPLVATAKDSHGKGYFQTLFSCIEKLLAFSNVKNLILPAADEAISIWTDKFGFKKIPPDRLCDYRENCSQLMMFNGTSMLQKNVPNYKLIPKITE